MALKLIFVNFTIMDFIMLNSLIRNIANMVFLLCFELILNYVCRGAKNHPGASQARNNNMVATDLYYSMNLRSKFSLINRTKGNIYLLRNRFSFLSFQIFLMQENHTTKIR